MRLLHGAVTGFIVSGVNHLGHVVQENKINEGLKEYFAIVAGESSDNVEEAQGIGEVILRRLQLKGKTISKGFIKYIGGEGQYDAIGGIEYNTIMKLSLADITNLAFDSSAKFHLRIVGAMSAYLYPYANVSNGAFFWNATVQKNWNDKGMNWRSYYRGTFEIAKEIGQTTFFKYSDINHKQWP